MSEFVPSQLIKHLSKLSEVFDFGHVLLNEEVAIMPAGTMFGELALINPQDGRLSSISTTKKSILTYIEKGDLDAALNKMKQAKLNFLRAFRLFRDVTATKLLTLTSA